MEGKPLKVKLFYNKTFPFMCHAIWNLYRKKVNNNCKLNEIEFIKESDFDGALKVEFLEGNSEIQNKKMPTSDVTFSKVMDYNFNLKLYYQCVPINKKTFSSEELQCEVALQGAYDDWVDLIEGYYYKGDIVFKCEFIDTYLKTNTFFHSNKLTLIDIYMYYTLYYYMNSESLHHFKFKELFKNLYRWFKMIKGLLDFKKDAEEEEEKEKQKKGELLNGYLEDFKKGRESLPAKQIEGDLELPLNLIVSMRKLANKERNKIEEEQYIKKMKEYQEMMQRIKEGVESEEKWNQLVDKRKTNKQEEESKNMSNSYEGKLVDAEFGKVITRFPPEPSGFLHIGHAKAAILNSYYANYYKGKMLLRFDDTNPVLEDIKYEESIIEDLEKLGIKYEKISYTSQYFDELEQYCIKMIEMGKAYADDTEIEEMRYQRGEGIESKNRNISIEESLKIFNEMRKGSDIGIKYCIRAKIDMQSKNKCMRDPVLYRCIIDVPHHKHQFKYKCYPTYDFACPIIDSIEGITHALRTNEYSDRIEQYYWVLNTLQLRNVHIYEFSRIAFVKTVMSKRKLKWFVENKIVDDWNDPRMPTIKGIMRRGLTKEALFKFIIDQGPSKAVNLMQWDKLWAVNKQIIDPIIPRYTVLNKDCISIILNDLKEDIIEKVRALHMKNEQLGACKMYYLNKLLIEKEDAMNLSKDEEITLTKLGNIIIKDIIKKNDSIEILAVSNFSGDFKKTKKKIHWLPNLPDKLFNVILYEYDHLITVDKFDSSDKDDWRKFINPTSKFETQAFGDTELYRIQIGESVQFERRGYYILDKIENNIYHFIKIPDGKAKNMSIISTKVDAQNLAGTKSKE